MSRTAPRLFVFFWLTDVAFIVYWAIVFLRLLPAEYMYQDYRDPNLVAWNLSFFRSTCLYRSRASRASTAIGGE